MPALTLSPMPVFDQRSAEILGSIRHIFAEKGFDGASMQDLARAAGMSVGDFYRYFPSKAAIIEAIVTRDLEVLDADFARILQAPDPMHCLRCAIAERLAGESCPEDGPLWAEISAAALRKPDVQGAVGRMDSTIAEYLVAVFAHVTGLTLPEAERRFGPHAAMIVMMVKAVMQTGGRQPRQDDLTALVRRMMDTTLDEIAHFKTEGST